MDYSSYIYISSSPPLHSNAINDLIWNFGLYDIVMVRVASGLLLVLLLWHVAQAFVKRLWLLPSHSNRVLALNAATLSLLAIVAKPPKPGEEISGELRMLACTVLICAMIGALMPSVAAFTDLKDMWSNVIGVGLLVMSVNFIIFLQLFYVPDHSSVPTIHETAMEHKVVMASLFLLLLVLLMQAVVLKAMMSDIRTVVLQRLDKPCMEAKPGYKVDVNVVERRAWSWEVVEHNTHIKLMMVLTSNPQNVMSRSPCAALVGALVLLCVIISFKKHSGFVFRVFFHGQTIVVCGFICIWRWVRVALQEDRSFSSLVSDGEPSYWCREVNNFQHMLKAGPRGTQPNVLEEGQWGFQEVIWYTAAFLMLCFVIPFLRLLVALTRFTQILSALLVQNIIWRPIRTLRCGISPYFQKSCQVVDAIVESPNSLNSLGVVCLEGEDARIVGREFAGAAARIIQKQSKKAKNTSDLKALIYHLQSFQNSKFVVGKSSAILVVLNQDGAPRVENLHVEHGYQYGWTLTALFLLALLAKIEVTILGKSTVCEVTITAFWQAMEMMQLVDEQFVPCLVCSKETYASACTSAWSKLRKKKRRWTEKKNKAKQEVKLDAVDQILKATLEPTKRHMEEFNKAKKSSDDNIAAAWSQQVVMSYTMHTVCQNLSRCWSDVQADAFSNGGGVEASHPRKTIEGMVEHINALIGEVLACCLSNLPTAIDMSTTDAVRSGRMSEIEKGLVLVAQGKHLWGELQWPTLHSSRNTGLGQLRQWMH